MQIKQFEDKILSHFSYAILSDCEKKMIVIDPARDPKQYLEYARDNEAQITAIIETHPHADFVSSHLELHQRLHAPIYTSREVHALYPHQPFNDGHSIRLGKIQLRAIDTPGHSPDSICILLEHVEASSVAAMLKNAPHQQAAKDFMDFLLSRAGKTVYKKYGCITD